MTKEIFDLSKKATLDFLTALATEFSGYGFGVLPSKDGMSILVSYRDGSRISKKIETFLKKNEYLT